MVGVTFDYNIVLPERKYKVGESVEHNGSRYTVRALGKSFLVFLVPTTK